MKNTNKKFNKLLKHFGNAEEEFYLQWKELGGNGRIKEYSCYDVDCYLVYDSILGEETAINFEYSARQTVEMDFGDRDTPASSDVIGEVVEIDIYKVEYLGELMPLTKKQKKNLEDLIEKSIKVEDYE